MFKNKRISEVMPHLESVARDHGLKLNRVKDFKIARKLLLIRYLSYGNFK